MYTAYFYVDSGHGNAPVGEYLARLKRSVRARCAALIALFEEKGRLPFPYASHLKGPIWELRIREERNHHRILYAIIEGERIILLTAFTKHTPRTPIKEIIKAENAIYDYHLHQKLKPFSVEINPP